jgi:acyl-coenzyme A synthetase/AMP-(fatty) acid ligase
LAVHRPEELVAVGGDGARTAAALEADALRVAAALAALPPGEVVVLCTDRYRVAVAMHAAWAAGHAVVFPPNLQPQTLEAVVAGARAVLHDRDGAPGGLDVRDLLRAPAPAGALTLPPPERCLVTFMTSGSTGAHQRYPRSAARALAEVDLYAGLIALPRGARLLATVPPQHIYGNLYGVLLPLRAGGAMVRTDALHGPAVAAELTRHAVTMLVSVPAHLATLVDEDGVPRIARVLSAGAPLPLGVAEALQARHGWRVGELYGATEIGGMAIRDAGEEAWTPYPGVMVGIDEEGGLLADAPWADPAGPRPFPVADRIELRPDGRFVLLGRRDGVVKVAGKRVALREVEERVLAVPGVRDAAALAQPSPGLRGTELWVAVAADGLEPARIREALVGWLEPVALPRRIRVVPALPREATGKLRRDALLALFAAGAPAAPATLEPEGEERPPCSEVRRADPRPNGGPPQLVGIDAWRLTFTVPPGLPCFAGHFPGDPVLPGVVQLDALVARQVERLWPDAGALRTVKRLKFSRVIRPGERLVVELARDRAAGTVQFSIDGPGGRCASGTLVFQLREPP